MTLATVRPSVADDPVRPASASRLTAAGVLFTVAWWLLLVAGAATFVDLDVWHSMALAREALRLGHLPLEDRFAYTPTVYPVVHHEWGSGFLFYFLAMHGGTAALQVARAALIVLLAVTAVSTARARGATPAVLAVMAPPAIVMTWIALTALRPQLITLALLALLLRTLELDRRGRRWWIAPALLVQVLWQNLHGGFVVGIAFVALHALDEALHRRPFAHLVAVAIATAALVAVNPYGLAYYPYLARALLMPRPLIGEWGPIWDAHPAGFAVYLVTVGIAAASGVRLGRDARGLPLVAVCAWLAASHQRHVSIWALAWLTHVPAWVSASSTGRVLDRWWTRPSSPSRLAAAVAALGIAATLVATRRPWRLTVPGAIRDGAPAAYPVGPVEYLAEAGIHANVLVPFEVGAYVSWKLDRAVKVSLDSRFEAAFAPELLREHLAFFAAAPGWADFLRRYPTDVVFAPTGAAVAARLPTETAWRAVYRDDAYVVFARSDLALPLADHRGERLLGSFP